MKELKDIIALAQKGNKCSTQEILEMFNPLINKYVRQMKYDEDFRSDMILHLIETVKNMDLSKFKVLNNYSIINYIKSSLYHHYIFLSKKQSNIRYHENQFETEDIEEWLGIDHRSQNSIDQVLIEYIMQKRLTAKEYICVKLMVIDGLTSSEAAKKLGITRQSVNESKNRGLKKLKEIFENK